MICRTVKVDGVTAIVCGSRPRAKKCRCGRPGSLLCDWEVEGGSKTCDKPICHACAREVAPDKHLCRAHQSVHDARMEAQP